MLRIGRVLDRALDHAQARKRVYEMEVAVDNDREMEQGTVSEHTNVSGLKEVARRYGIRICNVFGYCQLDQNRRQPSALRILDLTAQPAKYFFAQPMRLIIGAFPGKNEMFSGPDPGQYLLHQPDTVYATTGTFDIFRDEILLVIFSKRCSYPRPRFRVKSGGFFRIVKVRRDIHFTLFSHPSFSEA